MSIERLVELGAQVIGGVAYIDRKEVGRWVEGSFITFPEGATAIATADKAAAAAKAAAEAEAAKAAAAKTPKAPKTKPEAPVVVEPPVAPVEPPADPLADLSAALAGGQV